MATQTITNTGISRLSASVVASSAFVVPLMLSASSAPSPVHPKTFIWYKTLREPAFKPPDWAFPLAWTGLEVGLFLTAYRLMRAAPSTARTTALALWGWNVLMIGGWSRLFFKRHQVAVSTVASASLVVTSAALVSEAKKVDTTASRAAIPLVGWVAFATALTGAIWVLNRRR